MAQTTPPTITPAPTPAPQRGDRTTFSDRVDDFVTWLTAAVAQFGAVATNVYNNAVDAFNSAVAASTSASNAQSSADSAALSASAAGSVANASMFNAATNYAAGQSAISAVNFRTYRRLSAGTSATDPANDPTNWADTGSISGGYSARTANVQLARGDSGKLIDVTTGGFTQTVASGATLGIGWFVDYRNSSSAEVILDLAGTLITTERSGQATYRILWDGSAFRTVKKMAATGYLRVSDIKASGTAGGTSVATTITSTRTFNSTDVNTIAGASLSADEVTLPPGTYRARGRSVFSNTANAKIFLYNTTDSTYTLIGLNGHAASATNSSMQFSGQFTITAPKNFKMRYYAATAQINNGLGQAIGSGQLEVYSVMEFEKVG